MRIGVLALQGAFIEHVNCLQKTGAEAFEIRQKKDIERPFDGLILLAKQVDGGVPCFAAMDISVKRNAYGRQLGSFYTESAFDGATVPMTFIRAPYIESVGEGVTVLSRVDGKIVAAWEENKLVTAFHPELCSDETVIRYFLDMVKNR